MFCSTQFNTAEDGTLVIPSEYLEVVDHQEALTRCD